ncbi:hypothetical protein [uncultured Methanobrevibacter sp.]|uniref:hypothetical protein n=1 Tax=uncultured Methanobrevibacter sp. TaxID=253161 RepID=UPI00260A7909|nr:hypothetical protein [uncultured Methanobrevibacter sp.]
MRRKKDDKRVLRPGNGSSTRKRRRNNNRSFKLKNNRRPAAPKREKIKGKRSSKTVFIVIVALVAFIIGAGIGISLSFDEGNADNSTHIENVTVEMTSNLNESNSVVFNESDHVDYNENQSLGILREPNYGPDDEEYH